MFSLSKTILQLAVLVIPSISVFGPTWLRNSMQIAVSAPRIPTSRQTRKRYWWENCSLPARVLMSRKRSKPNSDHVNIFSHGSVERNKSKLNDCQVKQTRKSFGLGFWKCFTVLLFFLYMETILYILTTTVKKWNFK